MTITVYTSPTCQPCKQTKRFLENKNIYFQEKNADEYMEYLHNLNARSLPVVEVEDHGQIEYWTGLRPDKLNALTQKIRK